MINVRETEIRTELLEIVIEAYRVANDLKNSPVKLKARLVDKAFMVSAQIANAFTALQDDYFETEIQLALDGIDSISDDLIKLETDPTTAKIDFQPFRLILKHEKLELQALLAPSHINDIETLSPKLEKVCI